jgi:ribosomal protein S18 acetylase RimI-like enzyme
LAEAGEAKVGLTADDDNVGAVTLYRSLGFHSWEASTA